VEVDLDVAELRIVSTRRGRLLGVGRRKRTGIEINQETERNPKVVWFPPQRPVVACRYR
jgi:hypothetical protein